MTVAHDLIDRENEARLLRRLSDSGQSAIALVYGRRRVGKTFLLKSLWPADRMLYFTATDAGSAVNRRVLIDEAARWSGADLRSEDLPTWRAVFGALFRMRPQTPAVLILDEFQYLAQGSRGLREITSELNAVWEGPHERQAPLFVVLAGSAASTLEGLSRGGSPLYGRLETAISLAPFDYFDAGEMVPRYSPADRVRTYAAFGGMPAYLAHVDDTLPIDQNIIDLLLTPTGTVGLMVRSAIEQQEGLRNVTRYRAILASVGIGRASLGEVAAALGASREALREPLRNLVELSFVEERFDFGTSRRKTFQLSDPAERFFYGITLPLESALASGGPDRAWTERIAQHRWPTYVGQHVFEEVAAQAYRRWGRGRGLPAVPEWKRWTGKDRTRRQVDIDLVGSTLDGAVITGSVKFRNRPADARTYLEHVEALRRLADSGHGWANEALEEDAAFYFVSAGGFSDSFFEAVEPGRELIHWTLDDLYPAEG